MLAEFIKQYKLSMLLLVAVLLLFYSLKADIFAAYVDYDLAFAQAVIFPLVIFFIWQISKQKQLIPGILIIIAAITGVSASLMGFSVRSNGASSIHVARLKHDEYGAQSRVFLEDLNAKLLAMGEMQAFRYRREITDRHMAEEIIKTEPAVNILLWGDKRSLKLSFAGIRTTSVAIMPTELSNFADLQMRLITQIPIIGISHEPAIATQAWLALVTSALQNLSKLQKLPGDLNATIRIESKLKEAATMLVAWRSAEPLGFAWWQLGNFYMLQSIQHLVDPDRKSAARGTIDCAIYAYRKAAKFVFRNTNTELFSAIHNNFAVASLLKRNYSLGKIKLSVAKQSLLKAFNANRSKGNYQATNIVAQQVRLNVQHFKDMLSLKTEKFSSKSKAKGFKRKKAKK